MTTRQTRLRHSQQLKRFSVTSDSGRKYIVSLVSKDWNEPSQWQCSCPGWTMHTPRRNCKHIRHVQNVIGY